MLTFKWHHFQSTVGRFSLFLIQSTLSLFVFRRTWSQWDAIDLRLNPPIKNPAVKSRKKNSREENWSAFFFVVVLWLAELHFEATTMPPLLIQLWIVLNVFGLLQLVLNVQTENSVTFANLNRLDDHRTNFDRRQISCNFVFRKSHQNYFSIETSGSATRWVHLKENVKLDKWKKLKKIKNLEFVNSLFMFRT